MFLVLQILFDPQSGWRRAVTSGRSVRRTLILHLLPLLLVGCVVEGFGIVMWGKPAGDFGGRQTFELGKVMPFEVCHAFAGLVVVLVCAFMLVMMASTFQRRQRFSRVLVVCVFSLGPVFLARIADAFPSINPWLSWGVAALVTVAFLYQGLPRVLHIDPAHAMGLYVSASVAVVLVSGVARVLMVMLVQPLLLTVATG